MSDLLQDRYRLLRPLGSGGGGQSYLADDAQTGRRVVVKALYTPASGPPPPEVALLQELDHPQVQRLVDVFIDEVRMVRRLHRVTAWVPGRSLAEVLAERRLGQDEVAELLDDLLGVVGWLHGRSPPVLHRDLKPGNVILGDDGKLVLIDFDLATDGVERTFQHTMAVGTLGYQAPEQIAGAPCPASDVYSVGVLALELWTRRRPATMLDGQRLAWEGAAAHLAPRFRAWLSRALAPKLADRFATAQEARRALHAPLAPPRPPPAQAPAPSPERSPARPPAGALAASTALAAGVALAVGAVVAVLLFAQGDGPQVAEPVAAAPQVTGLVGSPQDRCAAGEATACLDWGRTLRARDPHAQVAAGEVFAQACALGAGEGCWERARAHGPDGWLRPDAAESGKWWIRACLHNVTNACDALRRVTQSLPDGTLSAEYSSAIDTAADDCPGAGEETAAFRCSRAIRWVREGRGLESDPARAVVLARQACEAGATWACHQVAEALVKGDGVPVDRDEAAALYRSLCDGSGDRAACDAASRLDLDRR